MTAWHAQPIHPPAVVSLRLHGSLLSGCFRYNRLFGLSLGIDPNPHRGRAMGRPSLFGVSRQASTGAQLATTGIDLPASSTLIVC